MTSALHSLLVAATEGKPDLAIDRANYLTAWQLSLDSNLDAVTRQGWADLADAAAYRLCKVINHGRDPRCWPLGVGSYDGPEFWP